MGDAYRILVTMVCGYVLLVILNVFRFTIQGMGFTMIAIISGAMEVVARGIAGLLLVPAFGFVGACLAHPLAWLF